MTLAVLDTGALIAFKRNDRGVVTIVARALHHKDSLLVPAGVVAQSWRDGRRQARLARLLGSPICEILALDDRRARVAGQLCGVTGTTGVVDTSVVAAARENGANVISSDPKDLMRLNNQLDVVAI